MTRLRADSSGRQHLGERNALPDGIANGLRAPQQLAGDRRDAGELTATIARAFECRGGRAPREALAQVVEREVERRPHQTRDGKSPFLRPHYWKCAVVAHIEQLTRGDER